MKAEAILNSGLTAKNSIVIVPSHRLKWDVYFRYLTSCLAANQKAKQASELNIVTLHEFMEDILFRTMSEKAVLTYSQELLLVKRILDGADTDVLSSIGLARSVSQAAKYIKEYKISEDSEYYLTSNESRLFREWLGSLDAMKEKLSLISAYDLPLECETAIKKSNLNIPKNISMVGFIHETPAVKSLFEACANRGSRIEGNNLISFDITRVRPISFSSLNDEILYCAKWVNQLVAGLSNGQVVTVAVPSIDDYRDLINETFSAVLPKSKEPIWDIGGGLSLLSYPEAQSLVDTLSVELVGNDIELIQRVINSEFVDLGMGRHEAGVFMARIRAMRKVSISMQDLLGEMTFLAKDNESYAFALTKLVKFNEMLIEFNQPINIASWGIIFAQLADVMGWMKGAIDNPLKDRIASDMLEFRSMSRFTTDINKGPAVAWLREHFQLLRFSYPRQVPSVVHVVSYGDALGSMSKAAWVLGLSADAMPGDLKTNTLIPHSLQQVSEMPTRNWDAFYDHSKTRLESLLSIAPIVVTSFCERNEKGLKMTPCTMNGLFEQYKKLESKHCISNDKVKIHSYDVWSDTLPAVTAHELEALTGTAGFLDGMKNSPFNASIKRRFKLYEIETEVGLSYANQGDVLHMAMDIFWDKFSSKQALINTSDNDLLLSMEEAVTQAVKAYRLESLYGSVIADLEVKQTTSIAVAYVDMIKKSNLEYTVLAGEFSSKIDIEGLAFNVRIDQVLSEGGQLVVNDFKRSVRYRVNWMKTGGSPDSLQLPLYVGFTDYKGAMFKGAGLSVAHQDSVSHNSFGPAVNPDFDDHKWESLVSNYRGEITNLVKLFKSAGPDVHTTGRFFPSEYESRLDKLGGIGR
jgi:hypothetical protein